jgi:hypothetical protein
MREEIFKQKWSKELKKKADILVGRFVVPERHLKDLIELINLAQQDITDCMPDCESCNEGQRSEPQYSHNEGYD